jgi:hypothetical protein
VLTNLTDLAFSSLGSDASESEARILRIKCGPRETVELKGETGSREGRVLVDIGVKETDEVK